jgi:hypothetical protein
MEQEKKQILILAIRAAASQLIESGMKEKDEELFQLGHAITLATVATERGDLEILMGFLTMFVETMDKINEAKADDENPSNNQVFSALEKLRNGDLDASLN